MDFFENKNKEFYKFLDDTFNLKKCKTWDDVSQQISFDKIKATYKFFGNLFPRNFEYIKEFGVSNKFRTLHFGNLRGNSIIDDIVRFSLYSDEILVFHPLQNPSITNHSLDPRKKPRYWMYDFISALHFYIVLKKWVEAGIVKLIVNPVDFDLELRDEFDLKARKRVEAFLKNHPDIDKDEATDNIAEHFANFYGEKPLDSIIEYLLELQNPVFTIQEAQEFAKKIKSAYSKRNPLFEKLKIPHSDGLVTDKMGAAFESILYISNQSGSNIYTSRKTSWEMLKDSSFNDSWAKFNYAYSKVDLSFLTNVETNFVLNLRKEGRLNKLRNEFSKNDFFFATEVLKEYPEYKEVKSQRTVGEIGKRPLPEKNMPKGEYLVVYGYKFNHMIKINVVNGHITAKFTTDDLDAMERVENDKPYRRAEVYSDGRINKQIPDPQFDKTIEDGKIYYELGYKDKSIQELLKSILKE